MARLLLALIFSLIAIGIVRAHRVPITILETAVAKGAVCLDGSPPAYAHSPGYGDGIDNWSVYIQGGAWCQNVDECLARTRTIYGSSTVTFKGFAGKKNFDGLYEDNSAVNPDFYNWNTVHIFYCDGSSFMSDVDKVDPAVNLTYRGARIYNAVMDELLRLGMGNAKNALLSGGSAGGLATILHCDKFKTLFADTTRVKCLSDSGFFIHGEHFVGADWRENIFSNVISTHGLTNLLPASCTSKVNPNLCLFPEYLVQDVKTPLFLIESSFDQYQIANHVFRDVTPRWHDCTSDLTLCNSNEITTMKDFRNTFLSTFTNTVADSSSRIGYFVHTCYIHGHIFDKAFSTCSASVGHNVLDNKSIAQAVGDWYFDRSEFEHMDIFNDLPRNCSFTDWPTLLEMCMAHEKS
ncbi:pectin acetylesterase 11-like [Salvia splendens]|uniref:pectin acetylesterase 11-like n=1 Tax=Salvia splendens TaxID=180675 RepID=UPI001C25FCED|nr:pectin acetylesterase 11-like [Salvia splendens]